MRSSAGPRLVVAAALFCAGALAASCATRPACDALGCAPACPRDASRDAAGRCACAAGTSVVLGACVAPEVGDAYCGPGERMGAEGCSARPCAADEAIDLATGACAPRGAVRRDHDCADASVAVDRGGVLACLRPGDTCPHGTRRNGERCDRPPACPPGSLPEGTACRSFVSAGAGPSPGPRVDVGVWAALALGVEGGRGTDDVCRAIARRADLFELAPGDSRSLVVHITLTIPDDDTTRTVATVGVGLEGTPGTTPSRPPSGATEIVERAVTGLVEPFRGLGGESSTAALDLRVRCAVGEAATSP